MPLHPNVANKSSEEFAATYRPVVEAAEAYAKCLKVGDVFLGVSPEAKARYPEDDLAQGFFRIIALDHLPQIWTTWEGNIITKVEHKA